MNLDYPSELIEIKGSLKVEKASQKEIQGDSRMRKTRPKFTGFEGDGEMQWAKERRWYLETEKSKNIDSSLKSQEEYSLYNTLILAQ